MKRKSIIICLLTILLLIPVLAQAAPVGKFTNIEGNVDVTASGKEAVKANVGDTLNAGDIIRTKSKSKAEVAFIDGSILRLAENSRLRVSEFSQDKETRKATLNLFRGKIQNAVKAVSSAGAAQSKYEIHTPTAVCGVRGTQFFTYYQSGVSGTVVTEGTVYAYSANKPGDIRTVSAGQAMVVTNPNVPPTVRPATAAETQQHQKDTTPAEKPKDGGKKSEDDKKSDTGTAKADNGQQEGAKKDEGKKDEQKQEAKTEDKQPEGKNGEANTNKPAEESKTVTAAAPADQAEQSAKVDIVPKDNSTTSAPATDKTVSTVTDTTTNNAPPVILAATSPGGSLPDPGSIAPMPGPTTNPVNDAPPITIYVPPVDTVPPQITLSSKPNQLTNASTAVFQLTTDKQATVKYSLDNGASWSTDNLQGTGTTFSITLPNLADKTYGLLLQAANMAGYENPTPVSYTWTVDTLPPSADVTGLPTGPTKLTTATLAVTSPEPGATYQYSLDGGQTWTTIANPAGQTVNIATATEGTKTLLVKATDELGNTTDASYTWLQNYTQASGSVAMGGFLSSGSLSAQIDPASNAGTLTFTGVAPAGLPAGSWGGTTGGNLGNDAYSGYLTGVSGSWEGLLSGIYVTGSGAGYITGDLAGSYDAASQALSGTGTITKTDILGQTSLSPSLLASSLKPLGSVGGAGVETGFPLPLLDSIDVGGAINPIDDAATNTGELVGITVTNSATGRDRTLSVWGTTTTGGVYKNPTGAATWGGVYGRSGSFNAAATEAFFMLGNISGTDDGQGHVGVSGALTYLEDYQGKGYLGSIGLAYRGKYESTTGPGPVLNNTPYSSAGAGTFTLDPLTFGGIITGGTFQHFQNSALVDQGSLSGLWGGTATLGNVSSPFVAMGKYDGNTGTSLFTADMLTDATPIDNVVAAGFIGGTLAGSGLDAGFTGLYARPLASGGTELGFLSTAGNDQALLSGADTGFWMASGNIAALPITNLAGAFPGFTSSQDNSQTFATALANEASGGPAINIAAERLRTSSLSGYNWGIFQSVIGGTYDSATLPAGAVNTVWSIDHNFSGHANAEYQLSTTLWNGTNNTLSGQTAVAVANWDSGQTLVGGGSIRGTFDPGSWVAAATGGWMETGSFLQMAGAATTEATANATLQALNIPSISVGTANLSQVDPTVAVNNLTNLSLNNVRFFATSTGGVPRLWATDGIAGNYSLSASPAATGSAVHLSSGPGGLDAYFGIRNWDASTNIWGANIIGGGALAGGGYSGTIGLNGAGAGSFGNGTLTGTAAGTALAYASSTDHTPPGLSFLQQPAALTNSSAATFAISPEAGATYRYSFDGSTYTSLAGDVISRSSLPEGQHTMTLSGTDAAGNLAVSSYTWTTDYTPPAVALTSPPLSLTNIAAPSFIASSTKGGTTIYYSLDGGSYIPAANSTINLSALSDGSHHLDIKGVDAAGNTSPVVPYSWIVDTTAPIITLSGMPDPITNAQSANIGVTASEGATYTYTLNGAAVTSPNLANLPEGSNTFAVTATDAVGNSSTKTYSWTTDYHAPVLASTPPPLTKDNTAAFTLSPDTASITYTLNGNTSTVSGSTLNLSSLPEGAQSISITATDDAGNTTATPFAFTWNTDYHAPVLASTPPPLTKDNTAAFTLSPDTASITYTLNGSTSTVSGSILNLTSLPEGAQSISITATDAAGNITATPLVFAWSTDYTPPAVNIAEAPGKVSGADTTSFVINATDVNPGNRYYRVNGGAWQSLADTPLTFAEGLNKIEFKADDLAGNESLVSADTTYEWFIGKRQFVLQGSVTGGLTGSVLPSSEGIRTISEGGTGAWLLNLSGNYETAPSGLQTLVAGGQGHGPYLPSDTIPATPAFNGYWISHIDADAASNILAGNSAFTYLSATTLGQGQGAVTGSYSGGAWQAQDLGLGTYTESPLALAGPLADPNQGFAYTDASGSLTGEGSLSGLLGSTVLPWNTDIPLADRSFLALGTYANPNNRQIWWLWNPNPSGPTTTTDGGALLGDLMGVVDQNGRSEGIYGALFVRPNGKDTDGNLLYRGGYIGYNLAGGFYPGLGTDTTPGSGMWEIHGTPYAFYEQDVTGITPDLLTWDNITDRDAYGVAGGDIATGNFSTYFDSLPGQHWGVWSTSLGGFLSSLPGGTWSAFAGGQIDKWIGNSSTPDGYWLAGLSGGAWTNGKVDGNIAYRYLTSDALGTFGNRLFGAYQNNGEGYTWQAVSGGVYTETPLDFSGSVSGGLLYYNSEYGDLRYANADPYDSTHNVHGLLGGIGNPWTTGATNLTLMGTYSTGAGAEPYLAYGSGWYLDYNDQPLEGYANTIDGAFKGYNVGLWNAGSVNTKALTLYIDPDGNAGYLSGDLTGNYYPGLGMWEMNGTLAKEEKGTTGIGPDQLAASVDRGSFGPYSANASGKLYSTVEGTPQYTGDLTATYVAGALMGLPITTTATTTTPSQQRQIGIWNGGLGGTVSGTAGSTMSLNVGSTDFSYEAYGGAGAGAGGYMLANITSTDFGPTFTGALTASFITPYIFGDVMTGDIYGSFDGTYWQAAGVGRAEGTPTDFGGDWSHSTLYNDYGYMAWNNTDDGLFGFRKRADGLYDFLSIGEYYDYGYGGGGFGGPYIWSGSMYDEAQRANRYLEAFSGGIWQKGDPSDPAGTLAGYTAALYYTEDKVGLITGGLQGAFYEMRYDSYWNEMYGMWKLENVEGGLTDKDKTASLPADFNVATASINSDSLYGYTAGSFLNNGENIGTIRGEWDDGSTKFITYYDASDYQKSLPFGIYNLTLGYGPGVNNYSGRPVGSSVLWNSKIGYDGDFGYNYSDYGYWLADMTGTWDDYGAEAGHGTIKGNLSGTYITSTHMGSIGGPFYGLYTDDGEGVGSGTWIGMSVGTYEGTPTDFGGDWNHSLLYNGGGAMQWNSYGYDNEGAFGFIKRADGKYDFLAIGGFYDYGNGEAGSGGPYIWSGSLWNNEETPSRYMEALTGGIWKKADPRDPSGAMEGFNAGLYYTEDGKVGLITGGLAGNFYEMQDRDGEMYGMWKLASVAGGLNNIDKTASLPEDFAVSNAYVDSHGGLKAQTAGGFASTAGQVGNIQGEYYNNGNGSTTKFIAYDLYDASSGAWISTKSLPFGIYTLKLGGDINPNYYFDKPEGSSVSANLKMGGDGYFSSDSNDHGYWLTDVAATWDAYSPGARHGAINGSLVNGRYMTSTQMGTIGGPLFGLYTADLDELGNATSHGDWIGNSVGTWEGKPLAFASGLSSGLNAVTRHVYGDYSYTDGGSYNFDFYTDNHTGWVSYFRPASATAPAKNYTITYNGDGTYTYISYDASGTPTTTPGNWLNDGQTSLTFLWTPPDEEYNSVNGYEYFDSYNDGNLEGLMGGTASLWTATAAQPAALTMLGTFSPSGNVPHLWNTEVYSYNYNDSSYTTYDGGAYRGFLAGTESAGAMIGGLMALYVDPSGNAGYLKGALTGTAYRDIGMFQMEGSLYPTQIAAAIGIAPQNFYDSVWQTYDYLFDGKSILAGSFTAGGAITSQSYYYGEGSRDGHMSTMSIVDYEQNKAAPWGIYELSAGGTYAQPGADWTAKTGGRNTLGAYRVANYYYGTYYYAGGGNYSYDYYTDNREGHVSYSRLDGTHYYTDYYRDGSTYTYNYVTGASTPGIWDTTKSLASLLSTPVDSNTSSFSENHYGVADDDDCYWLADISDGAWSGNRLTGKLRDGRFITYTKLGTLGGDVSGVYNTLDNTWQAFSLGNWNGTPLSHVSALSAGLTAATRHLSGSYSYADGGSYSYDYYADNHAGTFSYRRPVAGITSYDISYYQDGTSSRTEYSYGDPNNSGQNDYYYSSSSSGPGSLTDSYKTPPDPESHPTSDYAYEDFSVYNDGYLEGLMGGTASLWMATAANPAPVTMLGNFNPSGNVPHLWMTGIYSYNYANDTYTTYDGGAYIGYLAGAGLGKGMDSRLLALYLDPLGKAGYLRGSLTGSVYPEIGMLALDGTVYPDAPVDSASGIAPVDLVYSIVETGDGGTQTLTATLGADGKLSTDYQSLYTMSLIKDGNPQGWGIYRQELSGRFTPATSGDMSWSGMTGGQGYIGAHNNGEGYSDDYGYFLADVSGTLADGKLSGNLAGGRFITGTRLGTLSGDLFGVYNTLDNTWQGAGLGTWQGEALTFSGNVYGLLDYYTEPEGAGTGSLYTGGYVDGSSLLGGTGALLGGSPVTATLMGAYTHYEYSPYFYQEPSLLYGDSPNLSGNTGRNTPDTSDDGAFYGHLIGIWNNGEIERAKVLALAVGPDGRAGVVSGDLTGKYYPTLNLWEAAGNLTYTDMGTTTVAPGALSLPASLHSGSLTGGLAGLTTDNDFPIRTGVLQGSLIGLNDQNWGIWNMALGGSFAGMPGGSVVIGGGVAADFGRGPESGYWLSDAALAWNDDPSRAKRFSISFGNGHFLSETVLGTMSAEHGGGLLGSYDDPITESGLVLIPGIWQAAGVGTWGGLTDLTFVSDLQASGWDSYGSLTSLLGGTSNLWSGTGVPVTMMGEFNGGNGLWASPVFSYNFKNDDYTTYAGGAYLGFNSLVMDGGGGVDDSLIALYVDPSGQAGYLKGQLSGNVQASLGLFEADGTIKGIEMGTAPAGVTAANFPSSMTPVIPDALSFVEHSFIEASTATIAFSSEARNTASFIADSSWGIWQSLLEGDSNGVAPGAWTPPSAWEWTTVSGVTGTDATYWTNYSNVAWVADTAKLAGDVTGARADWVSASTYVYGGEIKGLYDPALATWKAVAQGAWMETSKFLDLASTNPSALQALNIPAVQVGSATLSQGAGTVNNLSNVTMEDVRFFATSTGGVPKIWATNNVHGSYNGPPVTGAPTTLTGGGLSADFTLHQWNDSKWGATVTNGNGVVAGQNIQFKGGAAGTVMPMPSLPSSPPSGTFSGTGAGIVKKP